MTEAQFIPWKRIAVEGAAIVASILLAFAIDAWWQDRTQAALQHDQLQMLVNEFRTAKRQLEWQVGAVESSLRGTIRVLELMGPTASSETNHDASAAFTKSFNVGVSAPQQGVLQQVVAASDFTDFADSELWSLLHDWPTRMGDLELDGQHLERNREEDYVDALVRLGVSLSAIMQTKSDVSEAQAWMYQRASRFDTDETVVLRDPGVETLMTMRAMRSRILISNHNVALRIADEIIELLELRIRD